MCVIVCEQKRESVCERERESVCVCVCACNCVCSKREREREKVCVCEKVFECEWAHKSILCSPPPHPPLALY